MGMRLTDYETHCVQILFILKNILLLINEKLST